MESGEEFGIDQIIIDRLENFCMENGIWVKEKGEKDCTKFLHVPMSLQPSPFDREAFENVTQCQLNMNNMISNLMQNMPRVRELLHNLSLMDDFIGNLVRVSKEVEESGYKQKGYLGVLRFDYMFDDETKKPKMIEFNTIASSFGPLSHKINKLHWEMIENYNPHLDVTKVRKSKDPKVYIGQSIKAGFDLYFNKNEETSDTSLGVVIAMLDRNERNVMDMGAVFDYLKTEYNITLIKANFDDIAEHTTLDEDGVLRYDGHEVAVVYYRTCYDPTQYKDEGDWDQRIKLEKSSAIKCPSIDLQLLTIKKIQEELNKESIWNEFHLQDFENIREFFTGMYGLDKLDEETKSRIEDAKSNFHKYVLKTQREGGGHNYFGESIPKQLEDQSELGKYSLMERIFPVKFKAFLLRDKRVWIGDSVSELGIFGTLLVKFGEAGHEVIISNEAGWMMRTKPKGTDEGGVAAGYAYVDNPYLVERDQINNCLEFKFE